MSKVPRRDNGGQTQLELELADPLLRPLIGRLVAEARYPESLVMEAYRVTALRMTDPERPLANPHAFLMGTLRRLALASAPRKSDTEADRALRRTMKERFLIGSVVADLRESGMPDHAIYHQLLVSYGDRVSAEVLAEFGRMLLSEKRAG